MQGSTWIYDRSAWRCSVPHPPLTSTGALASNASSLHNWSHCDSRPHLLALRGLQCHARKCCERDVYACGDARTAAEGEQACGGANSETRVSESE
jgi:hypothetical protein